MIHFEAINRGPTGWGNAFEDSWIARRPLEVVFPAVAARMKQSDIITSDGVKTAGVFPFAPVAMAAGNCKILQVATAVFHAWNDVVNGKCGNLTAHREKAVFAAMPRPHFQKDTRGLSDHA